MSTNKTNDEISTIDEEINKAISTISELEEWIKELSNDEGIIRIEKESPIKSKFSQLHMEVQSLTKSLTELGILDGEDL
ncbi:hypothetical protein NSA47_11075 [Irregularibacter muris]|uniref:Uncharacterized protein n=1 Tax=Irregularibacter muris TaxID=1796619 RepID=A0AAE3HIY2_9FIRM|nr:hypothetical protein [Irregularibacter muris]MCR1899528.1 hypothetical protein [Irregularibacter muris]